MREAFLAEGAALAIASRSEANLANAQRILGTALTIAADLVDEHAAAGVVDAVERELGPIDVLVNSAGAARRTPPDDLTPQAWRAAMDAKYFTYINVIDPVVKRMAATGNGGHREHHRERRQGRCRDASGRRRRERGAHARHRGPRTTRMPPRGFASSASARV